MWTMSFCCLLGSNSASFGSLTVLRTKPFTEQPCRAVPRAAESVPGATLKLDAPGTELRGLSGESFRQ